MTEPQILKDPPRSSAVASPPSGGPASCRAEASPETDGGAARAELARAHLEAVAARAGLDDAYTDVVETLFLKTGKEATKANMSAFVEGLKKTQPALFSVAANTSPPSSAPHAPTPGVVTSATSKWAALRAAGRMGEAEGFYKQNRAAIIRGQ